MMEQLHERVGWWILGPAARQRDRRATVAHFNRAYYLADSATVLLRAAKATGDDHLRERLRDAVEVLTEYNQHAKAAALRKVLEGTE